MTLIVTMGTASRLIVVADRRLTGFDGHAHDILQDQFGKMTMLWTDHGRYVVAMTGYAWHGPLDNVPPHGFPPDDGFSAPHWLFSNAHDAAPPGSTVDELLQGLAPMLTERFEQPPLDSVKADRRRLQIVVAGYDDGSAVPSVRLLANLDSSNVPRDAFDVDVYAPPSPAFLKTWAWDSGVEDDDRAELQAMLEADLHEDALIGKANAMIRRAADSPKSHGVVGKNLNAVAMSADTSAGPARGSFHPENAQYVTYGVGTISTSASFSFSMIDGGLSFFQDPDPPAFAAIPAVPRNARCPCGSGQKFKRCHGDPRRT